MIRKISLGLLLIAHCDPSTVAPESRPEPSPAHEVSSDPVSAAISAPALSGGTLLVERGFSLAWISNPDADAVEVVDYERGTLIETINFPIGSEPGRLVEDALGRVHVVLRRGGAIASIDRRNHWQVVRKVCPAPRGIAIDNGVVWVACAGGELMSMPTGGGDAQLVTNLGRDLRDVVIGPNGLVRVSRFRSAQVVTWDGSTTSTLPAPFNGEVAWRTVPVGAGYAMLYQRTTDVPFGGAQYYTSFSPVSAAIDFVGVTIPCASTSNLFLTGLVVDLAVREGGDYATVSFGAKTVTVRHPPTKLYAGIQPSCNADSGGDITATVHDLDAEPVAVAFAPDGRVIVQTRRPALMVEAPDHTSMRTISLKAPVIGDRGYTIFHTPTAGGLACASCHPEGGEDGHTWEFASSGLRRTQSIRGGILSTAPFHWEGDIRGMNGIVTEVYERRMGGRVLSADETAALARFVDRLPSLPPPSTLDADAVARGAQIFDGLKCGSCHAGPKMTDNAVHDVGLPDPEGGVRAFQTPSLLGVGARAPYTHTGCAKTLAERFTKCSFGPEHTVPPDEIPSLVAYLESL